jgi:hypothetical protein
MIRVSSLLLLLTTSTVAFGQVTSIAKYSTADRLLKLNDINGAYNLFKELKAEIEPSDTLYEYVVWYYVATATDLEKESRIREDFTSSLNFGLEAFKAIDENKHLFDDSFAQKEPWAIKNIIVSYFGLGQSDRARKYRDKLYEGYNLKSLPQGIDEYFNFDFFKLDGKNVWGYEWYPELPADRFSGSFTKIIYYVYSTNPDGTDKDQLYRLHVLMFHQSSEDTKFDYLLERQQENDKAINSGSYYQYTYKKDIDYVKLKQDVKDVIKNEIQPSSRRTVAKGK